MRTHNGFTLIELAMVLLIIGLLTGGLLMPLSTQYELKQRQQVQSELKQIKEALMGFYLTHGYFPCPASTTSFGQENNPDIRAKTGACKMPQETDNSSNGFVPYQTLGLTGYIDSSSSMMLDVWGNPYRYSISNKGVNCSIDGTFDTNWAYTSPYAFKAVREKSCNSTLKTLLPNLKICDATGCSAASAVLVVFSLGKNWTESSASNSAESKNKGTKSDGGYPLKDRDKLDFFITDSNTSNSFDDLVEWISPNVFFSQLAKANML